MLVNTLLTSSGRVKRADLYGLTAYQVHFKLNSVKKKLLLMQQSGLDETWISSKSTVLPTVRGWYLFYWKAQRSKSFVETGQGSWSFFDLYSWWRTVNLKKKNESEIYSLCNPIQHNLAYWGSDVVKKPFAQEVSITPDTALWQFAI